MKDLHEDDIIRPVSERLRRYGEAPSEGAWEKIAATQQSKNSVWPVWIESVSLAGMGVMLFAFLNFDVKEAPVMKEQGVIRKEQEEVVEKSVEIQQRFPDSRSEHLPSTATSSAEIAIIANDASVMHNAIVANDSVVVVIPEIIQQNPDSASIEIEDIIIPPNKKTKNQLQVYLSITPSLAFQKVIPDSNDEIVVQGFGSRPALSVKRFGFGIDAGIQRSINNIFGLYGGLTFYRQQQEITYSYYDKDAEVTRVGDAWTFDITRERHTKTFDYTMTNVGVRTGVLITLKGERLKHKIGAGLSYSRGLKKGARSYDNSRSGYLAWQISYRNEIMINDRWSWFAEPIFVYSFTSKEKLGEPFVLKPYRAGVSFGTLYRF
jgi:hypothetical protein